MGVRPTRRPALEGAAPVQVARDAPNHLDPDLLRELSKHAGKWVALTRERVVAVAETSEEAEAAAAKKGVTSPILYFVPQDKDAVYLY